jgi:tetratricopeptide (TPR) repeat protein
MRRLAIAIAGLFLALSTSAQAQVNTDCRNTDRDQQVRLCTNVIQQANSDSDKAVGYLYRCQAYDILGRYKLALVDCREAQKLNPADTSVHNSLAIIYYNLGQFQDALAEVSEAIKANPQRAGYYNVRANTHCRLGNFDASYDDRMSALTKGYFSAEALQGVLKRGGFYTGSIDGNFGAGSKQALRKWTRAGCSS